MIFFKPLDVTLAAGMFVGASAFTKNGKTHPEASANESARPYPLGVCLVSGEKLGEMGDPVRIVHEGREIKFCCDTCQSKFKKGPGKYLVKLDGSNGE